MPVVTVQQGPRDTEAKRRLVARITEAFDAAYGLPPETVHVWIQEYPAESRGMGGKLRADS